MINYYELGIKFFSTIIFTANKVQRYYFFVRMYAIMIVIVIQYGIHNK